MTDYMDKLKNCEEFFWVNPGFVPPGAEQGGSEQQAVGEKQLVDIDDAEARLARFAPFIERMFPEVKDGIIESPLTELTGLDGTNQLAALAGAPDIAAAGAPAKAGRQFKSESRSRQTVKTLFMFSLQSQIFFLILLQKQKKRN